MSADGGVGIAETWGSALSSGAATSTRVDGFVSTVPAHDPLAALAELRHHDLSGALYWRDAAEAIIGLGAEEVIETSGPSRFADADARFAELLRARPELRGRRWFGGFGFEDHVEDGPFAGFGALRFVLPEIVWRLPAGATHATLRGARATEERLWSRVLGWARQPPRPVRRLTAGARVQVGSRPAWDEAIARAHRAFARGEVEKVVLSRDIVVRRDEQIEPAQVLAGLLPRSSAEAAFCVQTGESCFLGLTPERLVEVGQDRVRTEAVAGSSAEDDPDGAALLESAKDREEHRYVVDHLLAGLAPFVERVEAASTPELRRLGPLAHLSTPIEGLRRGSASVLEIAGALHPTPAVNGVPVQAAREVLASAEHRPRGWYAGAVGWVEPDEHGSGRGDLRVALRSALVRGSEACLFVGAGIVPASTADGEWDETALKSTRLLSALGGA